MGFTLGLDEFEGCELGCDDSVGLLVDGCCDGFAKMLGR